MGLLIDQNTRDLIAKRYGLLQEVVSWFKVIELSRRTEDERMIDQQPTPTDLRYHKTWLATLIAEGERLVTEIQVNGGLAENPARIKSSDVEAPLKLFASPRRNGTANWPRRGGPNCGRASLMSRNPALEAI